MPMKAPRICGCGFTVPAYLKCECQVKRAREAQARHDANRPSATERGYDSKWQRERAAFLAVNRTCKRCGAPSTVVDHIEPHRGNMRLFWNRSNWAALCTTCHSRWKQAREKRGAA